MAPADLPRLGDAARCEAGLVTRREAAGLLGYSETSLASPMSSHPQGQTPTLANVLK